MPPEGAEENGVPMCLTKACVSRTINHEPFLNGFLHGFEPTVRSNLALFSSLRLSVCCATMRKLQEEDVEQVSWPHVDQNNLIPALASQEKTCRTSVNKTLSTKFVWNRCSHHTGVETSLPENIEMLSLVPELRESRSLWRYVGSSCRQTR